MNQSQMSIYVSVDAAIIVVNQCSIMEPQPEEMFIWWVLLIILNIFYADGVKRRNIYYYYSVITTCYIFLLLFLLSIHKLLLFEVSIKIIYIYLVNFFTFFGEHKPSGRCFVASRPKSLYSSGSWSGQGMQLFHFDSWVVTIHLPH